MVYLLLGLVVAAVGGLFFGATMLFQGGGGQIEDRLQALTQNRGRGTTGKEESHASVLMNPLDETPSALDMFFKKFNLNLFLEQSGLGMSAAKLVTMSIGLGTATAVAYMYSAPWKSLTPLFFLVGAPLPLIYVWFMRGRRLKKFGSQLPDALDLMGQAMRAGQSLPAGIQLVSTQMAEPIGPEFARAFEQQNLGIPLEESLRSMTLRIPNLDLKFFVTSIVLQRQTGGDLAEILDKISKLIRERFQIWGQIQSLTGEGRLSGIVLLALPPTLFVTMLKLNYDYVMMLFDDPLGQKMLAFGIVMQVLGAATIKKIITIKV